MEEASLHLCLYTSFCSTQPDCSAGANPCGAQDILRQRADLLAVAPDLCASHDDRLWPAEVREYCVAQVTGWRQHMCGLHMKYLQTCMAANTMPGTSIFSFSHVCPLSTKTPSPLVLQWLAGQHHAGVGYRRREELRLSCG